MEIRKKIKFNIPTEIKTIQKVFKNNGFKLFIVGGAIRDILLKLSPKDIDLATDATPEQVEQILNNANIQNIPIGKAFGVISAVINNLEFEIATFREDVIDTTISDGRHPDSVTFSTIDKDVLRRDFTINALFLDLDTIEVVDLIGGLEDLKNGIIRTVGNAKDRFEEDRLRVIRALRFSTKLNFKLHDDIIKEIKRDNDISNISNERIKSEMFKGISASSKGRVFLRQLNRFEILKSVFKGLNLNRLFSHTSKPEVAIAFLLMRNDIKETISSLKELRFKNCEIDSIIFLMNIRNFIVNNDRMNTLLMLKRKQKTIKLTNNEIMEFVRLSRIDKVFAKALLKFELTVTGDMVMKRFNIIEGKEIGDKILELEIKNFKESRKAAVEKFLTKERVVMDAKTDISTITKHSLVNLTHGFLSGLAIAMIASGNYILIGVSYYIFKRFDSLILNRDKYTTKFGQDYVFPIPSTLGFMAGCYASYLLTPLLK